MRSVASWESLARARLKWFASRIQFFSSCSHLFFSYLIAGSIERFDKPGYSLFYSACRFPEQLTHPSGWVWHVCECVSHFQKGSPLISILQRKRPGIFKSFRSSSRNWLNCCVTPFSSPRELSLTCTGASAADDDNRNATIKRAVLFFIIFFIKKTGRSLMAMPPLIKYHLGNPWFPPQITMIFTSCHFKRSLSRLKWHGYMKVGPFVRLP